MTQSFLNRNFESNGNFLKVSFGGNDEAPDKHHYCPVIDSEPDWHLQAWMQYLGKRQADLAKELGWAKGRANKFYHGQHPYRRDVVNELSAWLGIQPYELLMSPQEALQLRHLRQAALAIAAQQKPLPPINSPQAGRGRAAPIGS